MSATSLPIHFELVSQGANINLSNMTSDGVGVSSE